MKNLNVLSAFLCGTVVETTVGTVLGVLFAPDKGSNTRMLIADKLKETHKMNNEQTLNSLEE